jgi:hypothetical protein
MQLDKKLELMLKKRIELEKLLVEQETLKAWRERLDDLAHKSNDYRSFDVNITTLLKSMDTRLASLRSEIGDLKS